MMSLMLLKYPTVVYIFFFTTSFLCFHCCSSNFLSDKQSNDIQCARHLAERKAAFLTKYPSYSISSEKLSSIELTRFVNHTYLDYTGSGVYQQSQLKEIYDDLSKNAYGNAHSHNPSAELTNTRLRNARARVLQHFNATDDLYSVVFTSGATASLKMVGEDFPWSDDSLFYYLRINHNSVLGIREYGLQHHAQFKALSEEWILRTLAERKRLYHIKQTSHLSVRSEHPHHDDDDDENVKQFTHKKKDPRPIPQCLFAYPPKDNFAGRYYPLDWISDIQKYGLTEHCQWRVLVDAAAYVPTKSFSLTTYPADFFVVSFYKMMGYPTGLGALLVRNDDARLFNKVYFGGGAVVAAACDTRWCKMKDNPSLRFEDGTVAFLSIVALPYGFDKLQSIGMKTIEQHVSSLSLYLYDTLLSLQHLNGKPLIDIYFKEDQPCEGGIVNFNVLRNDGSYVPFTQVQNEAADAMIHLRSGCFCNSGGCQDYLGLSSEDIKKAAEVRQSCADPTNPFEQKPQGSIRASVGYLSEFVDVESLIDFLKKKYLK